MMRRNKITWLPFLANIALSLLAGYFLVLGSRRVHTLVVASSHTLDNPPNPSLLLRPSARRTHHLTTTTLPASPFRQAYTTAPPSFKIYVYDMPASFNTEIRRENRKCSSSMFASEVAIHTWLLQNTDLRTMDPNEADLFYVPAYTTCRSTPFAGNGPDPWAGKELMSQAIAWVHTHHPKWWGRRDGKDHIFTAVHDYATCFDFQRKRAHLGGPLKELDQSIVLMSLGDRQSPCYNGHKDIPIPTFIPSLPSSDRGGERQQQQQQQEEEDSTDYLTANWHMYLGNQGPEDLEDENSRRKNNVVMNLPKASRAVKGPRPIMVFFWGQLSWTDANGVVDDGYSHGIRQRLKEYYAHDLSFVMHHVNREGDGSLDFMKYSRMLDSSVFCLSPAGFAPWTKRLYEGEKEWGSLVRAWFFIQ